MTTQTEMFAADQGAGRRAALRGALDAAEAAARETLAAEARLAEARLGFTDARGALADCRRRQDEAQHALALAAAALAAPDGGAPAEALHHCGVKLSYHDEAHRAERDHYGCADALRRAALAGEGKWAGHPGKCAGCGGVEGHHADGCALDAQVVPLGDEVVTLALPAEVAEPAAKPKRSRKKKAGFGVTDGPPPDDLPAGPVARHDALLADDRVEEVRVSMAAQAMEALKRHPGMLLLFRDGRRYVFPLADHAAEAAALDVPRIFEQPQLEHHLKRLLGGGKRVAVCDADEPPRDLRLKETTSGTFWARDEGGVEYSCLAAGTSEETHQFPRCPKEGCRALLPCANDLPGGEYECVCKACRFGVLRESGGTVRLELIPPDDVGCKTWPLASADLENAPPTVAGIACWLPGPLSRPPHLDAPRWDAVLDQLRTLPSWWGRSDDLTARLEQELVKSALRGTPFDLRDRAKIGAICHFREQCWATPVWHEWAEFDVSLPDATQVRCVYLADFGGFDRRHFMFRGPAEVLSDTGVWVTWAVRDNAAKEGEGVVEYAARVCAAAAHAYAQKARKRGKKHAPQAATEDRS